MNQNWICLYESYPNGGSTATFTIAVVARQNMPDTYHSYSTCRFATGTAADEQVCFTVSDRTNDDEL